MSTRKRPADKLELAEPHTTVKRTKHSMNQTALAKSLAGYSAHGEYNEPHKASLKSLGQGWSYNQGVVMITTLQDSMKLLQKFCETLPPLQSAVGSLLSVLNAIEIHARTLRSVREIESDLVRWTIILSEYLSNTRPEQMSKGIEGLFKTLQEQTERISTQQLLGQMKRTPETEQDLGQFRECFRRIEVALCRLQSDASLNNWRMQDEQAKVVKLRKLLPVMDARHDSAHSNLTDRRGCCPNTRVSILEGMRGWTNRLGVENILYLYGLGGAGKTTIAYSICTELEKDGRLGASFFCSRALPACRDIARIIPSIAYQLARLSFPFKWALCKALESVPDIQERNLCNQFETLIVAPFLEVKGLSPNNLVVVIDALDECSYTETTKLVLDVLLTRAVDIPVRFLVTSRPDSRISQAISPQSSKAIYPLCLDTITEKQVKHDIATYLQSSLVEVMPSKGDIERLTEAAECLFIYASTAVRYILQKGSSDPRSRLKIVLNTFSVSERATDRSRDKSTSIDRLYGLILEAALNSPAEKNESEVLTLLSTVIAAREPVTLNTLARLLGVDYESLQGALPPLTCVLTVSGGRQIVSTFHSSFSDYMLNNPLVSRWVEDTHSLNMAQRCFDIMKKQLRFNICNLETSYSLDTSVPNLQTRVETCIQGGLSYACRYWADHLTDSPKWYETLENAHLSDFLSHRLLFWMEVLNLMGLIDYGPKLLTKAQRWLSDRECSSELRDSLRDALSFVTTFSASPVHLSTPHIYISALPSIPRQSKVWESYGCRTRGLLQIHNAYTSKDQMLTHVVTPLEATMMSGSWMFNTQYIPHRSEDGKTVAYIPNGLSPPVGSFTGHPSKIGWSSRTSGASDTSSTSDVISFWPSSTHMGEELIQAPRGPTVPFTPIQFSFVNNSITSDPNDETCLFNGYQKPTSSSFQLLRHISGVPIPDGSFIYPDRVNAPREAVWECTTRSTPSIAHRRICDDLRRVNFSPNSHTTSCFKGNTTHVWDAQTGEFIDPSQGRINYTTSISVSPDGIPVVSSPEGLRVIYSSRDIRVPHEYLYIHLGQPTGGKHAGLPHDIDEAGSLATNSRAISKSYDRAIQSSEHAGGLTLVLFRGHQGAAPVGSIALPPNGTCICSPIQDVQMCDPFLGVKQPGRNDEREDTSNLVWRFLDEVASNNYIDQLQCWSGRRESVHQISWVGEACGGTQFPTTPQDSRYKSTSIPSDHHISSSVNKGRMYARNNSAQGLQELHEWKVDEQGWIVDSSSRYLFWIPQDLRKALLSPQVLAILSGAMNSLHTGIFLGESWHRCYEQSG